MNEYMICSKSFYREFDATIRGQYLWRDIYSRARRRLAGIGA